MSFGFYLGEKINIASQENFLGTKYSTWKSMGIHFENKK